MTFRRWQLRARHARLAVATLLVGSSTTLTAAPPGDTPPVFPMALVQRLSLPTAPIGPPAVSAGVAVVVQADGDVVAFDLADGAERWRRPLKATHRAEATDGDVFVTTADTTECLALETGAVRWRAPRAAAATAAPLAAGPLVLVATATPALIALDRSTGDLRWSTTPPAALRDPLVAAKRALSAIAGDNRLVTVSLTDGALAWSLEFGASLTSIAVTRERVYVGSVDNFLYAVDSARGRIAWRWRTGGDVLGAAAVDDERVYVASLDNLLRALDRATGTLQWKQALTTRTAGGPVLAGDVLLVTGYAADVRGFDTATGRPVGRQPTIGEIAFPPVAVAGAWPGLDRLVAVTLDNQLLVLRRALDPALAALEALPGVPVAVSDPAPPEAPPPPPR